MARLVEDYLVWVFVFVSLFFRPDLAIWVFTRAAPIVKVYFMKSNTPPGIPSISPEPYMRLGALSPLFHRYLKTYLKLWFLDKIKHYFWGIFSVHLGDHLSAVNCEVRG